MIWGPPTKAHFLKVHITSQYHHTKDHTSNNPGRAGPSFDQWLPFLVSVLRGNEEGERVERYEKSKLSQEIGGGPTITFVHFKSLLQFLCILFLLYFLFVYFILIFYPRYTCIEFQNLSSFIRIVFKIAVFHPPHHFLFYRGVYIK
jgi:hypothetical protein